MNNVSAHKVDPILLENRLLELSSSRSFFALYTSQGYASKWGEYELLFAWGAKAIFDTTALKNGALESGWRFGFLGYELRHEFERLSKGNPAIGQWPEAQFFEPEVVGTLDRAGTLTVYADEPEDVLALVLASEKSRKAGNTTLDFQPVETRESYLEAVRKLQEHIQRGDIYEVNYCTAFKAEYESLDSAQLFRQMTQATKAPFSAFVKMDQLELLCTSPERYILKKGDQLWSQPIKGTNRRLAENNHVQERLLVADEKERAENVMIVDLVRNDLSRVAAKGTVQVEELFGVYPFKNVNQMISTVTCKTRAETSNWEIIKATFPMGSMTGAPKISAMELAERYEKTERGIYSGALGYIMPNGDFDFNVVIRSIALDAKQGVASAHVGGAITLLSIPEREYEECLLKAESLLQSAAGSGSNQ
ncbi:MAG: anthranilate synthase component I family protein [Schleiferiaceae bacterium]|jgi:para-aminobenzoate synthetase component I|nr:anthranilate synthase component I family protein [Schleiferiaceae bacterium]MDP4758538.1 anthranilate synthase component I family protein [Schleiferiaceae bacterium]MDP4767505.1 anthranilate synthase component I family protein [Schleiferiaceae bacterium]MDP4877126.1 anthranilate synthase component I family protein [Schleiferiaceae bacterium]MDP4958649.1 anthranilate synthase component I family protein [Schleiferiaceae bacterium]